MLSDYGRGVLFALAAYVFWGVAPVYFKWVDFASAVEIVSHRVVWSTVLLVALLLLQRQWRALRSLTFKHLGALLVSSALIAVNWGVFVWALLNDRMLETSLGYYINPLVTALLGVGFLGERLRPLQWFCLLLAAAGVMNAVVSAGVLPWAGLSLAFSFGFYGLVRKRLGLASTVGLTVETALILPVAVIFLVTTSVTGTVEPRTTSELALLALGGLVTIFPLLCFGAAAVRLPLSILSFFQYIAPTLTLLLAVWVYGEPFRSAQWLTFGCIWVALVLFSMDALYQQRLIRKPYLGEGFEKT